MDLETIFRASEIIVVILGIGGILFRIGKMTERFELIGRQQACEIQELKESVKELIKTNSRMDRLEERQLMEGKRVDELTNRLNRYANGTAGK